MIWRLWKLCSVNEAEAIKPSAHMRWVCVAADVTSDSGNRLRVCTSQRWFQIDDFSTKISSWVKARKSSKGATGSQSRWLYVNMGLMWRTSPLFELNNRTVRNRSNWRREWAGKTKGEGLAFHIHKQSFPSHGIIIIASWEFFQSWLRLPCLV